MVTGDGDDRHRICGKLRMQKVESPEYNIVVVVDKKKGSVKVRFINNPHGSQ